MTEPSESSALWLPANWPAPGNIHAGITLRGNEGQGESKSPYHYFNLATHVGDIIGDVEANRSKLNVPTTPWWLEQVHSDVAVKLPARENTPVADASFTQEVNQVCVVMTADCLPLLVTDRQGSCVAAIHAGWKGLNNGIIEATINNLPVQHQSLMVWLGPAIGPDVYEIGQDVFDAFVKADHEAEALFTATRPGHWLLDMYAAARLRLKRLGIEEIYGGEYCTFTDKDRFYSYRRDGVTGRMASMIWLES